MSAQEKPAHALDVRVMERLIRQGVIAPEERDKYLSKLPDVTDKSTQIETRAPNEPDAGPKR